MPYPTYRALALPSRDEREEDPSQTLSARTGVDPFNPPDYWPPHPPLYLLPPSLIASSCSYNHGSPPDACRRSGDGWSRHHGSPGWIRSREGGREGWGSPPYHDVQGAGEAPSPLPGDTGGAVAGEVEGSPGCRTQSLPLVEATAALVAQG